MDIRSNYDQKQEVEDGILYRKGTVLQVWWDFANPQTWTIPTEEQAKSNFLMLVQKWQPES